MLGIGDGVDAGAALVVDSHLVGVASEQRHDQVPRSHAFPWQATEEVLEEAGVRHRDVDVIAIAGRFTPPLFLRRHPQLRKANRDPFSVAHDAHYAFQGLLKQTGFGAFEADRAAEWLEHRFKSRGFLPQRTLLVDIHRSLATAAYRRQPRDRALVITGHPLGDGVTLAVHEGSSGQLDLVWHQPDTHSVHTHLMRCAATIGLHPVIDEHRLWSLAARGAPDAALVDLLDAQVHANGPRLVVKLPSKKDAPLYQQLARAPREVAAASLFENLRRAVCSVVLHHVATFGDANVVLGGALFDNPRLCALLADEEGLASVSVSVDPGWGSLPIGAAMMEAGTAPATSPAALGRQFGARHFERALQTAGIERREPADPAAVAHELTNGRAVARFAGRAGEGRFGLGTRSVLVRADRPEALMRAKHALSRLDEEDVAVACLPSAWDGTSRCTLDGLHETALAPRASDAFARNHPAVVGADGRVILQLVAHDAWLSEVLEKLEASSGCKALAVLPLGRVQDPPVSLPSDALRVFARSKGLDSLVLGPYLVRA